MPAKKLLVNFHPGLADQIRPGQDIDISQLGSSSRIKIWWVGECGHQWIAEVVARVSGKGCPICSGQSVNPGENDFQTTYPDLAKEWHPTKNAEKKPIEFRPKSGAKVWWVGACGHEFEAKIGERVRGKFERPNSTGCPICLRRKFVSGINDLATTSPDLFAEFHPTLNGDLDPRIDRLSNKTKYYWICPKGHEFRQALGNRINQKQGCPFCKNKGVLPGYNDLVTLNKALLEEWDFDKNGDLDPATITAGTNRYIWWICAEGHSWEARGSKRLAGQGCPICMNRDFKPGFNDLESRLPEVAASWDSKKNNGLLPSMVLFGTHEKFWWKCIEGHTWETSPATRVRTGCPRCARAGFDQTKPGMFYFIENDLLRARKVGIANQGSDRLNNWLANGWKALFVHESEDGLFILNLETIVLRWIRKDLQMPPHLGKEEMGRFGGASETFSIDGIANSNVIKKIEELVQEIR